MSFQQQPTSSENCGYPTQKPESLLERIINASSNPGDIVFDCFMGSATTQAVAMRLGRKFIGADINLGSIQTATKRLINLANNLNGQLQEEEKYTGFEVYNVNNLKSVYLIATRDLSNLWLQFFLSQNQGFMRLFEKTVLK